MIAMNLVLQIPGSPGMHHVGSPQMYQPQQMGVPMGVVGGGGMVPPGSPGGYMAVQPPPQQMVHHTRMVPGNPQVTTLRTLSRILSWIMVAQGALRLLPWSM